MHMPDMRGLPGDADSGAWYMSRRAGYRSPWTAQLRAGVASFIHVDCEVLPTLPTAHNMLKLAEW